MNPEGAETPFPEVAHRVPRRRQFAVSERPNFVLQRGVAEISVVSVGPADDIPF